MFNKMTLKKEVSFVLFFLMRKKEVSFFFFFFLRFNKELLLKLK